MGRTTTQMQAALLQARRRRVELEHERDTRDQRVEEAAAEVLVLLPQTTAARERLRRLERDTGTALHRLLDEGLSPARIATLCELDARQVRRLLRAVSAAAPTADDSTGTTDGGEADSHPDAEISNPDEEDGSVSPPPHADARPSVG